MICSSMQYNVCIYFFNILEFSNMQGSIEDATVEAKLGIVKCE